MILVSCKFSCSVFRFFDVAIPGSLSLYVLDCHFLPRCFPLHFTSVSICYIFPKEDIMILLEFGFWLVISFTDQSIDLCLLRCIHATPIILCFALCMIFQVCVPSSLSFLSTRIVFISSTLYCLYSTAFSISNFKNDSSRYKVIVLVLGFEFQLWRARYAICMEFLVFLWLFPYVKQIVTNG